MNAQKHKSGTRSCLLRKAMWSSLPLRAYKVVVTAIKGSVPAVTFDRDFLAMCTAPSACSSWGSLSSSARSCFPWVSKSVRDAFPLYLGWSCLPRDHVQSHLSLSTAAPSLSAYSHLPQSRSCLPTVFDEVVTVL